MMGDEREGWMKGRGIENREGEWKRGIKVGSDRGRRMV